MQRFILKIACILCCLLFAWASGEVQAAKSSARHVSNRIKIVRPEKPSPQAVTDQPDKTAEPAQEETAETTPVERDTAAVEEKADMAEAQKPEALSKTAPTDEMRKEAIDLMGEKEELYTRKGRLDPFTPFVRGPEPESTAEGGRKVLDRPESIKTPLEKVSLGQLRLTAIMETPQQRLAMVEEASGKGYVVKEGTYIGDQGGQITKVLAEAIVIEEKYQDVFGNVAVREKQLKLQK